MTSGAEKGLRTAGVCAAAVIYLGTGFPTCAGHAGYFRGLFMRRAECTGTMLDAVGCAVAVVMAWLATRPKGRTNLVLLLVLVAFMVLVPTMAAVTNCTNWP